MEKEQLPKVIGLKFGILPNGHYSFNYFTELNRCEVKLSNETNSPHEDVLSIHHFFSLVEAVMGDRINGNDWKAIKTKIGELAGERQQSEFEVSTGHILLQKKTPLS